MDTAKSRPLKCTTDFHGFINIFSHGFDHPTKPASYLVEQRHFFLRNAPGCGIRCLPSSPVHCACGSPRHNHCGLSSGNVWVRVSVLGVKTSPLMEQQKDHHWVPSPVLSSSFQCVVWCTCCTRVGWGQCIPGFDKGEATSPSRIRDIY